MQASMHIATAGAAHSSLTDSLTTRRPIIGIHDAASQAFHFLVNWRFVLEEIKLTIGIRHTAADSY